MNAAPEVLTSELFDSLKSGQTVRVSFDSCMASGNALTLKVGRLSYSKKYNVHTLALNPADGRKPSEMVRIKLYKRSTGRVSMALGDMATNLTSFEIV
jgi:hypothetical protein